jgi:hypothetical protein
VALDARPGQTPQEGAHQFDKVRPYNGHPIFETRVQIARGQTVEVKYELIEPTYRGAPRVPIQPLLDNITPVVSVPECAG